MDSIIRMIESPVSDDDALKAEIREYREIKSKLETNEYLLSKIKFPNL